MVRCESCKQSIVQNAVYKLRVNVVDGSDSAEFLMLEDTAYELIGKRAREVVHDVVESVAVNGSIGADYLQCGHLFFPEIIHKIIGREKLLFRIRKQEDHPPFGSTSVYVVDRVCKAFPLSSHCASSSSSVPLLLSSQDDC